MEAPRPVGRRSGQRVAAGALLVLATVVTFWQVDLRRHQDQQFLAVARPVPAGAVISDVDLRVVRVANPSGLALVEADRRDEVVGRTAAVPLSIGGLVVSTQVGPPAWPPAGQALIAVQVGAGRAPAGISAGTTVVILVTAAQPDTSPDHDTRVRAVGTVVSVAGTDQVGGQVVTLLLAAQDGEAVASATGDVALVQIGAGQ
ncbi:SAF domain-containing protein [Micromonospora andamanensis]|uniref:SAF domain-containing protein n=1 Tax=Micromonospora andamanensis TaxID=1287068 RepID=A0ABQ4HRY7_9ACTN|nr:SAF domain-containing protein [Micromonospora andamanensis]GIJ08395.1 hypothetical protein Van01_16090 [Micromonospora andamanensis]